MDQDLRERLRRLQTNVEHQLKHLSLTLDWDGMVNDDEYTTLKYQESPDPRLFERVLSQLHAEGNPPDLLELYHATNKAVARLRKEELRMLHDAYMNADEDERPLLHCDCGFFTYKECIAKEHTCAKTTQCRECQRSFGTYARLEALAHIQIQLCPMCVFHG